MKKIFFIFLAIIIFTVFSKKAQALIVGSTMWGVGTAVPVAKALVIGGSSAIALGGGTMGLAIRGILNHGEVAIYSPIFITGFSVGIAGLVLTEQQELNSFKNFNAVRSYLEENLYSDSETKIILKDLKTINGKLLRAIILPYKKLYPLSTNEKIRFIEKSIPLKINSLTTRFIVESSTEFLD